MWLNQSTVSELSPTYYLGGESKGLCTTGCFFRESLKLLSDSSIGGVSTSNKSETPSHPSSHCKSNTFHRDIVKGICSLCSPPMIPAATLKEGSIFQALPASLLQHLQRLLFCFCHHLDPFSQSLHTTMPELYCHFNLS